MAHSLSEELKLQDRVTASTQILRVCQQLRSARHLHQSSLKYTANDVRPRLSNEGKIVTAIIICSNAL